MVKQAVLLAGGKGERLRPLTLDRPKPMVEVGGKPILEYQIEQLKAIGIEEIVLACSYLKEVIKDYFGDGSKLWLKIKYSEEETPLGRGGGIKKAMGMLEPEGDDVFVANGDSLWQIDLKKLISKHQTQDALATLVVVPLRSPYGIVEFNDQDQITGFQEKPILPHWINAGVYVFAKELEKTLPDVGDHEVETFPMLPKERFFVFQSTNYWRGVDTIKDLSEAEKELESWLKTK